MKISELTSKQQVYIKSNKQLKKFCDAIKLSLVIIKAPCYYRQNEHGRGFSTKRNPLETIPASKLLKQSISKKYLQKALSKVGEELSSMNERLGKLEAKNEPSQTANGIEVHFDEVTEGLPEKWCVKGNGHEEITEWFNVNGSIPPYNTETDKTYYFHYPSFDGITTASGIQHGYTEITFETFKKYVLKEEVKEAVELEVGKWYKDDVRKLLFCFSGEYDDDGDPTGYGFVFQRWNNNKDGWKGVKTPATETEVFEALKAEACKQYKVGKTVFDNWSNCKITLNDLTRFDYSNGNLFVLNLNNSKTHLLGSNGQWATIIPQPEIDFSKAGQLVKNSVGDILLTTGEQSHSNFEAIVIKHHLSKKPKIRAAKSCFTLCTEPVTLQN